MATKLDDLHVCLVAELRRAFTTSAASDFSLAALVDACVTLGVDTPEVREAAALDLELQCATTGRHTPGVHDKLGAEPPKPSPSPEAPQGAQAAGMGATFWRA
jgi:hypothetical protein